jgi:hypothetical protein
MAIRYLFGDCEPLLLPVATAQAISIFDLVALISNTLVRAEDIAWNTDLATTQSDFRVGSAGIAFQMKRAGDVRPYGNAEDNLIGVATAGVFEADCASASFNVGDFVGPAKAAGNALVSQTIVAVSGEANAIGKVTRAGASVTRVQFRLIPNKTPLARQS